MQAISARGVAARLTYRDKEEATNGPLIAYRREVWTHRAEKSFL
jgi:hypothetical protein